MWLIKPGRKGVSRGFTIIEAMIFCTILGLLMGCIAMVLEGGMRYLRLGNAYQDAQSQAMVGMRQMLEELGQASSVNRSPAPPLANSDYIIVLSPQPPPPATQWTYAANSLQYYQWLCFYRNSTTNELVRATLRIKGGPFVSGDAPHAPGLAQFLAVTPPNSRVIARGITALAINEGSTSQQLSLRLTSAVATNSQKSTIVTNRSLVTMPNP